MDKADGQEGGLMNPKPQAFIRSDGWWWVWDGKKWRGPFSSRESAERRV
jgi:hypothetical protein